MHPSRKAYVEDAEPEVSALGKTTGDAQFAANLITNARRFAQNQGGVDLDAIRMLKLI